MLWQRPQRALIIRSFLWLGSSRVCA